MSTQRRPIISLRGVSRTFESGMGEVVTILDNIDLDIEPGSFTVIRGQSGSGKTTLLRILGMLDAGFDGSYELDGARIDGEPDWRLDEIRAENLGFIFQEGRLFNHIDLRSNIAVPLRLQTHLGEADIRRTVDELSVRIFRPDELEMGLLNHRPDKVSGGQKQRASVMRAMISRPCIILADEPTASLHRDLKAEIVRQLHELRDMGHTVIVVSHDEAFYESGRQLEIDKGRLIELAPETNAHPDPIPGKPPDEGADILWGWRPRARLHTLAGQALREAFLRPIFLTLILTSLVVGVCQVGVFASVIVGTDAFVQKKMTEGSRLNRIEVQPRSADRGLDDRFPVRSEVASWKNVTHVVPRRTTTQTVVRLSGDTVPFTAMGLLPDDPEYALLDFVAGGPFNGSHDELEVIVTANFLGEVFDIADMQAGRADFSSFLGRTIEVLVPRYASGGELLSQSSVRLRVQGVILHGEGGRQLYMPNTTQLVFDRIKRDRVGEFPFPVSKDGLNWSDPKIVPIMADFPWEDRLHIYSDEIREIIPSYSNLAKLGYAPRSDIWEYKWALDIQDTAWSIFIPLLVLIIAAVSATVIANIYTSAKLRETELALWRVLGMRRGDIVLTQVLATVMSVSLGTLLGLLLGNELIDYIRKTLQARSQEVEIGQEAQDFDAIFVSVWGFSGTVLIFAVIIGICAALYPAFRASNVDPAQVLKS